MAKSFFDLTEAVRSADKKPEKYIAPDGKAKVRMVPVDKEVVKTEAKDPNEYDKEGDMMKSQLRQICSANEKLMKMVGDDDNLPEWVQSKVTKATDYIRSVRDYLESEKMDDDEEMNEKTLTPAEKKKREEIAKAMERENPGMDMSKKMAIATAAAKRVAEEVELDEAKWMVTHKKEQGTTGKYIDSTQFHPDERSARLHKGKLKHTPGVLKGSIAMKKVHPQDMTKEEVELDELSKKTLGSYVKKASDDRAQNALEIGKTGKMNLKGLKRRQGINRAVNKMANEEAKPDAVEVMRKKQQMANISTSDKDKLAKVRAMLDKEKKK